MGISDFDENGNRIRGWDIPQPPPLLFVDEHASDDLTLTWKSGIEKVQAALGIVPPTLYFVSGPPSGSILDALKTPNRDVGFAKMCNDIVTACALKIARDNMTTDQFAKFSKGVQFNPPAPYTGPDMNEVDAALEVIERMEA